MSFEAATVWRWHKVERKPGGPLTDTAAWWKEELDRRTKEGWRLVDQRPASFEGCTVYVFTRVVSEYQVGEGL